MKRLAAFMTGLLFTVVVLAQAPETISYQAVIRNASNALVVNTSIGTRISIMQGTVSGTVVYQELHMATTNANGLVTFSIGGGNVVSGVFSDINWVNGPFFLKTETDITGGTSYTITASSEMLSVPYALYSKNAGTCAETNPGYTQYTNLNNPGSLDIGNVWTNMTPSNPYYFSKSSDNSDVEIFVISNFSGGVFNGGSGIQFKVLVDGLAYDFGNMAGILTTNTISFLTLHSVYRNLSAGIHYVAIWAKTNNGTSTSVLVDPGGWGGTIVIKEER